MDGKKKLTIYTVSDGASCGGGPPPAPPSSLELRGQHSAVKRKYWAGGNRKATHAALCHIGQHAFAACGYDLKEIMLGPAKDEDLATAVKGKKKKVKGTKSCPLVREESCIIYSSDESDSKSDDDIDTVKDGADDVTSPGSSQCPVAFSGLFNRSQEEALDIIVEENEYDYKLYRNVISEAPSISSVSHSPKSESSSRSGPSGLSLPSESSVPSGATLTPDSRSLLVSPNRSWLHKDEPPRGDVIIDMEPDHEFDTPTR